MPFHPGREWKVLLDEAAAPAIIMGDRLKALAEAGQIKRETMITTGGLDRWIQAGQLKGLFPPQDAPPPFDASEAIASANDGVKDVHATMRGWEFAWAPVVFVADFLKPLAPFALYLAIAGWLVWAAFRFLPRLRQRDKLVMRHALVVALIGTFFTGTQMLSPGGNANGVIATLFPVAETFQDRLLEAAEATERNTAQTAENTKNIGTPKQETSDDPQKELMNLGIPLILYPDAWSVAINGGDIERLKLLERAGYFPARLEVADMFRNSTTNAIFFRTPEFQDLMRRHTAAVNEALCYDIHNPHSYTVAEVVNTTHNLGPTFLTEICGPYDIDVGRLRSTYDQKLMRFCREIQSLDNSSCNIENFVYIFEGNRDKFLDELENAIIFKETIEALVRLDRVDD